MTSSVNRPAGPDLFLLADLCSRSVVQGESLDQLLSRMESGLDIFFPPPPQGELRENPGLRRCLLRVMVRTIWQGIPQPALDFALPKLPEPRRNDRCHCGSGRKYKVCCQGLEREVPIRNVNFLPNLLSVLPRKYWKDLAGSRIDPSMVAHTVGEWYEEGESESVATLIAQGREEEARTRADFSARRLARSGRPELSGLVDWLRDVARRGSAAIGETMADDAGVAGLLEALSETPAPKAMYSLDPVDGDAGPLTPKPRLVRALDAWRQAIESINYSPGAGRDRSDPAGDIRRMLELLENFPELWHSFEALAELAWSARALDFMGVEETVIVPLLDRAESLLEIVLKANGAEECQLQWGFLENRPALDLLAWRAGLELDRPATSGHIQRLERLLQLNPNDNQGMRMPLSRRYLEADRFEDALALAERYPDDLPEMQYNQALALFALERNEQAEQVLQKAAGDYPKILDALLKSRIRRPDIDPFGIRLGGDDEAWIYQEENRPLWQRLGALKWARQVV